MTQSPMARPVGDRHHPNTLHGRRSEGQFRPSRRAHGNGADGLSAVDSVHAPRPNGSSVANRDRFVRRPATASHAPYSLLHLTGYGLTLEDLESFRQWGFADPRTSRARPHQGRRGNHRSARPGFANGVGMAIAQRRPGHRVQSARPTPDRSVRVRHLLRRRPPGGITAEAACCRTPAPGKLIYLYDDNHIQLDGPTALAFSDQDARALRFVRWHTVQVEDATMLRDWAAIEAGARRRAAPA